MISRDVIVLSAIKFKEQDLIVKCFSKEEGVLSLFVKSGFKTKKGSAKAAFFQPLTQLKVISLPNARGGLNVLREVNSNFIYSTLHTDIFKSSLTLFLSELLSSILKTEDSDESLYDYLLNSLKLLDLEDFNPNFHIVFLVKLTNFMGFSISLNPNLKYELLSKFSDSEINLMEQFVDVSFTDSKLIKLSSNQRGVVLEILIDYFNLHIDNFRRPNSLEVFKTIFH